MKPVAAAGPGEGGEVDRLQLAAVLGVAEEDHLLPLDLAERVVLDDDDLDRQLVLHRGGELGHQHREAAVADEGDALPVRDRRSGRRWRRAGRWPSRPGCPTASASGRAGPGSAARTRWRSCRSRRRRWRRRDRRLPSSQATTCGFIGLSGARAALLHQLPTTPACRPAPSRGSRGPRCARSSGRSACERAPAVADQPDLDRIAQADARPGRGRSGRRAPGRAWDRTRCRGTRCRPCSSVSHSSSASCDGRVPSRPIAAGRVRAVVRHRRLAEQRLDDRRAERLGQLLQLVGGAERAPAGQDGDLACRRSGPRRRGAGPPRPAGRALRAKTSEVWSGHVALASARRPPAPGDRRGS